MVTKPMITAALAMSTAIATLCLGPKALAQSNLAPLAWGIHNTGAPQQLVIDHYTSANIKAVIGEDIHLPPTISGRQVIVGVLDTGIDFKHPQLKDIIAGPGYNAIDPKADTSDIHGHGTHVSGIIAAQLNATGFSGVSMHARILPVKVVQTGPNAPVKVQDTEAGGGTALTEHVADGIVWAINHGAEVINLSLAWQTSIHSKKVDDAMALAVQKNVIIVSSSANDNTTADLYPCVYENVICVGSHGPDGAVSHFSNYGSMVDVLAPGVSILSTWPLDIKNKPTTFAGQIGYEFRNGTSMAAPFVTGIIAELLARGYSPKDARARLLLGTRPTALLSQISSPIVGKYTTDKSTEVKTARFGNVDVTKAITIAPSPLILPKKKGIYEIEWDGVSKTIELPVTWINLWKDAGPVSITIQDQHFQFANFLSDATAETLVQIKLDEIPEQNIHLVASVETAGYAKSNLDLHIRLIRTFTSKSLPITSVVKPIHGLRPHDYSDIRSVKNTLSESDTDLVFTRMTKDGIEIALVKETNFINGALFKAFNEDQFLKAYRLPDNTYALFFTKPDANTKRPGIFIEKLDAHFKFVSEITIGTTVTVLPDNFKWVPYKNSYMPIWISIGFTPPKDLPAYDPWHPDFRDNKMPRLYFLDESELRIIKLAEDEIPLQLLPDFKILISKGSTYFQEYHLLTLQDSLITSTSPLQLSEYRMLIGLDAGVQPLSLDGTHPNTLSLQGNSSGGNLRITDIGQHPFDQTLERSTQLDVLRSLNGSYLDRVHHYYFTQTNYNFQFFENGSDQTISTTQNRYSYIPEMISARYFFPLIVRQKDGQGLPALYIPATVKTGNTSEVIIADPAHHRILRPAQFKLRVKDGSCFEMAEFIPATTSEPAKQVFICDESVIEIPLAL